MLLRQVAVAGALCFYLFANAFPTGVGRFPRGRVNGTLAAVLFLLLTGLEDAADAFADVDWDTPAFLVAMMMLNALAEAHGGVALLRALAARAEDRLEARLAVVAVAAAAAAALVTNPGAGVFLAPAVVPLARPAR